MTWLLVALLTAQAHPFGAAAASVHTQFTVTPDHVTIDVVAELPDAVVRTAAPGADGDVISGMLRELASGYTLRANEDAVPLSVAPDSTRISRGSEHTIALSFQLVGAAPDRPVTLQLVDANLPDLTTWRRVDVHLHRALAAADASPTPGSASRYAMFTRDPALTQITLIDLVDRSWLAQAHDAIAQVPMTRPLAPNASLMHDLRAGRVSAPTTMLALILCAIGVLCHLLLGRQERHASTPNGRWIRWTPLFALPVLATPPGLLSIALPMFAGVSLAWLAWTGAHRRPPHPVAAALAMITLRPLGVGVLGWLGVAVASRTAPPPIIGRPQEIGALITTLSYALVACWTLWSGAQ